MRNATNEAALKVIFHSLANKSCRQICVGRIGLNQPRVVLIGSWKQGAVNLNAGYFLCSGGRKRQFKVYCCRFTPGLNECGISRLAADWRSIAELWPWPCGRCSGLKSGGPNYAAPAAADCRCSPEEREKGQRNLPFQRSLHPSLVLLPARLAASQQAL